MYQTFRTAPIVFLFTLFSISCLKSFANIHYIDINKISSDPKHITAFNNLIKYESYCASWTNEWTYPVPKAKVMDILKECYSVFSSAPDKNEESYLLLGDIAHY